MRDITEVFLRSGFISTPYQDFARKNLFAKPFEITTSHQVVPGDREISGVKFDEQMKKLLDETADRQKSTAGINLGVHVWQSGKAWEDLDAVFAKYAHRDDFWYCNYNQWTAYDRAARTTRIEPLEAKGNTRRFRINRATPAELGDTVPLTIMVKGATAGVKAATVDGEILSVANDQFDLPHSKGRRLPEKIDLIANTENAKEPVGEAGSSKEIPDVRAWLYCDETAKELVLRLENRGTMALGPAELTLRLPPQYADGLRRLEAKGIPAGEEREIRFLLGEERKNPVYRDGRAYFVIETEWPEQLGKRLITSTRCASSKTEPTILTASRMMGPFEPNDLEREQLKRMSIPATALTNLDETPVRQWFGATAEDLATASRDRVTLYRGGDAWKKAADAAGSKGQTYAVVAEIELDKPSDVKVQTEGKILTLFHNGNAANGKLNLIAGRNRVLVVLAINDGRSSWASSPVFFQLKSVRNESIRYIELK